jgi:CheY-like chemotaxis protein
MTNLVVNAGHEASLATSGYAAIRLATQRPPQVVLLEINMPGIDGYRTAKRLRKRFGHRFKIFAVTATPMDMRRAQQCGFDGIFAKPFDGQKLSALIAHLSSAVTVIASAISGGVRPGDMAGFSPSSR